MIVIKIVIARLPMPKLGHGILVSSKVISPSSVEIFVLKKIVGLFTRRFRSNLFLHGRAK